MLHAENISYSIDGKNLIHNVSVTFEPGKLSLIIGPNGAGKSTLIKTICHQLHPTSGKVHYNGRELSNYSDMELARIRAVLSQNIELAFPMKVWEVVMMGRYPHFTGQPGPRDEQACDEAMHFFDVSDMSQRDYMTLSGGEKQRVHFARVATQIWYPIEDTCRYLMLDEPLTFLDVQYQFHFMDKIKSLLKQNDLVVIGVVHDLDLASKYADQIILLSGGDVLSKGNKYEVLTCENIKCAFGIEPVLMQNDRKDSLYLFFD